VKTDPGAKISPLAGKPATRDMLIDVALQLAAEREAAGTPA